jgi:hypothetical protein
LNCQGEQKVEKHTFSVELKSKEYMKRVAIPNEAGDTVLLEGFLGELKEIDLVEGVMLEIKGANGILRMDLNEEELNILLKKRKRDQGRE